MTKNKSKHVSSDTINKTTALMLYKKLTRGIKGRVARCNLLNSTLFRN